MPHENRYVSNWNTGALCCQYKYTTKIRWQSLFTIPTCIPITAYMKKSITISKATYGKAYTHRHTEWYVQIAAKYRPSTALSQTRKL